MIHPTRPERQQAHVTRVSYDGRTWAIHIARTDLALSAPAPTDLPADVRTAVRTWVGDP